VAVSQRITGGDDPAWPDRRDPSLRSRRRWWPWAVIPLAIMAAGVGAFVVWDRSDDHPTTIGLLQCSSSRFRGIAIDYTWTGGPTSQAAALEAFLSGPQAKGLPSTGYRLISRPDPTYVHSSHGRVDVALRLERSGTVWEIGQVTACA
jgi:hypothetical protein